MWVCRWFCLFQFYEICVVKFFIFFLHVLHIFSLHIAIHSCRNSGCRLFSYLYCYILFLASLVHPGFARTVFHSFNEHSAFLLWWGKFWNLLMSEKWNLKFSFRECFDFTETFSNYQGNFIKSASCFCHPCVNIVSY